MIEKKPMETDFPPVSSTGETRYLRAPICLDGDQALKEFASAKKSAKNQANSIYLTSLQLDRAGYSNPENLTLLSLKNIESYVVIESAMFNLTEFTPVTGIYLENCPHVQVMQCSIIAGDYGIQALNCSNLCIDECTIQNFNSGGISIRNSPRGRVEDCMVARGRGNGIEVFYSEAFKFYKNDVSECMAYEAFSGNGIFAQMSNYCALWKNTVSLNNASKYKNSGNGIILEHCDYTLVESCSSNQNIGVCNSSSMGYWILDVVHGGTVLVDSTGMGIHIQSSYYTVVRHNWAINNSVDGFYYLFSDHGQCYNNTALQNANAGLTINMGYEAYYGYNWLVANSKLEIQRDSRMDQFNDIESNFVIEEPLTDFEQIMEAAGAETSDLQFPENDWITCNPVSDYGAEKWGNGATLQGFQSLIFLLAMMSTATLLLWTKKRKT